MKLLDRYVSHAIGSLGEYERDVMYRSMIIRRITLFWGTEVAAAALAWTLPANLVWWALIVFFLPMFVSYVAASVVVPPMVKQLNGWLRSRDERRLEAAFPED